MRNRPPDHRRNRGTTEEPVDDRDAMPGAHPCPRRITTDRSCRPGPLKAHRWIEAKRKWLFSVNPDDFSQIYFNDPADHTWHVLRWEHAPKVPVPFSLDALEYAKGIALDSRNGVDVAETLGVLLERWGAGRANSPAEKRISARLAVQLAETAEGPDSPFFPHIARRLAERVSGPNLRAELGLAAPGPVPIVDDDALALAAEELVEDDIEDFDFLEDL